MVDLHVYKSSLPLTKSAVAFKRQTYLLYKPATTRNDSLNLTHMLLSIAKEWSFLHSHEKLP